MSARRYRYPDDPDDELAFLRAAYYARAGRPQKARWGVLEWVLLLLIIGMMAAVAVRAAPDAVALWGWWKSGAPLEAPIATTIAAPQPTAFVAPRRDAPQPAVQPPAPAQPAEQPAPIESEVQQPAQEGTHVVVHPLPTVVQAEQSVIIFATPVPISQPGGIDVGGNVHVGSDGASLDTSITVKNASDAPADSSEGVMSAPVTASDGEGSKTNRKQFDSPNYTSGGSIGGQP